MMYVLGERGGDSKNSVQLPGHDSIGQRRTIPIPHLSVPIKLYIENWSKRKRKNNEKG